jgi:hypothetical protein
VRALLVCAPALAAITSSAAALAEPTFRASGGAAFVRFGERRATGGWGPAIGIEVGALKLGSTDFAVSYRNTLMLFNFSATEWLGAVDTNAILVSRSWSRYRIAAGPTAELLTIPLCTNEGWCARTTGIAPGAVIEIGGTYKENGGGTGLSIAGTGRYVPSKLGSWFTFGMMASGTFAW